MKLSKLPFMHLLLAMMAFGTVLSISSSHWLILWMGLELNLIGFLPVLVMHGSYLESEAAAKYFIVQSLGSILLLFGSMCAYSISFTWDNLFTSQGVLLMMGGLLAKLGCAPFHMWLPGVMANLSWLPCMLIATWQKIAPLYLFSLLVNYSHTLSVIVAVLSVLWGGVGGMNQTQLRALLAYSSIAHLGWMVLAMMVSLSTMTLYLSVYLFMTGLVFLSLWPIGIKSTSALQSFGAVKGNYLVMLLLLSLAGLPPLLGFLPKLYVISMVSQFAGMWLPLLVVVLGSVLSIYYYLYLLYALYMSGSGDSSPPESVKQYAVVIGTIATTLCGWSIMIM